AAAAAAASAAATPPPKAAPSPSSSTAQPAAPSAPGGSIQAIITAAFQSQGSGAVSWGLCIATHESGDNPNAVQPYGGAEGLFQFLPSTFARTPQGAAGASIFDATANAQAAAWMYSQGRQGEWSTNSMC
ncbi:MAG: transglycosylase SLT domain-containing protein, partial [Candidatus Dormiibacterota bacterium]